MSVAELTDLLEDLGLDEKALEEHHKAEVEKILSRLDAVVTSLQDFECLSQLYEDENEVVVREHFFQRPLRQLPGTRLMRFLCATDGRLEEIRRPW